MTTARRSTADYAARKIKVTLNDISYAGNYIVEVEAPDGHRFADDHKLEFKQKSTGQQKEEFWGDVVAWIKNLEVIACNDSCLRDEDGTCTYWLREPEPINRSYPMPDSENHKVDPEYIRELMKLAGMTQANLARQLKMGKRTVEEYTSRVRPKPYPYMFQFAVECLAAAEVQAQLKFKQPLD